MTDLAPFDTKRMKKVQRHLKLSAEKEEKLISTKIQNIGTQDRASDVDQDQSAPDQCKHYLPFHLHNLDKLLH